jgi:hypothetical protein
VPKPHWRSAWLAAELRREGPEVLLDTDPFGFALDCFNVRRDHLLDTPAAKEASFQDVEKSLRDLEAEGARYATVYSTVGAWRIQTHDTDAIPAVFDSLKYTSGARGYEAGS